MVKISKRELRERKHFDTIAEEYDYKYHYNSPFTKYKIDKKSGELVKLIRANLGNKNLKILEIGCGTGEYTRRLAKKLPKSKIIGLDISQNIVKIARNKCKDCSNAKFIVQSVYNTGLKKNSFDVVCGFYVLHHLDVHRVRKEILRLLRSGGILFFYEPNILNPVVYLIKANKALKKMVGDSPEEWAINPLKISKYFPCLDLLEISQTEFIWPLDFIPLNLLIIADKLTSYFRYFPLIKYFGGSVQISLKKPRAINISSLEEI